MLVFWDWTPRGNRNFAEVAKDFAAYRKEWLDSPEYGVLVSQWKDMGQGASKPPISNVVAMATNHLDRGVGSRISAIQLASVLTIMEILGGKLMANMPYTSQLI
jgi:hypothetical protein